MQTDNANIKLGASISLTQIVGIEDNRTVTIDMAEFTLDSGCTSRDSQVLVVRTGSTLNLSNGTLTGGWADNDKTDGSDYDYQPIHKMLEYNNLDMFRNNQRQSLGNVLLTGATGYLGIHILQELIDSDAKEIFCLVRDKDMDAAEHRLKLLLFYYFENTYDELFGKRIHIVVGDVTNDFTDDVKARIDTVFNCAAIVKHFSKGTEIEDVNIGGASVASTSASPPEHVWYMCRHIAPEASASRMSIRKCLTSP